ncbi:MAG: thioredoxin family protein [Lentisphaeria bacterium]|nr:thioredoxin family protein [Lentisphaeria bacterium]
MKKVLTALLLSMVCFCICAGENWRQGPDSRWLVKLEPALEKAKRENKFVFILQTGSDWCGFCVALYKRVFTQKAFSDLAKKHLVLVYLDFPRKAEMPQEQKDYNRSIVRKYRFPGGYPQAVVLNSDGKKVASCSGYSAEALYVSRLYQQLKLEGCPKFPARVELFVSGSRKFSAKGRKKARDRKCQNASGKAQVEIIGWGTSPDAVDRPFSAAEKIAVAPGKRVFFKVRYDLPKNCQAELSITDSDDNKWHGEKRVNRSGTYIFSTVAPDRKGAWASFSNGFKVRITPAGAKSRGAQGTLLCSIDLDMSLLSEKEREALTRRHNKTRAKFQNSRFEIVGWGYNRNADQKYTPGETIRVERRKMVCLKIRYNLPGKAAIKAKLPRVYGGYSTPVLSPASGEIIRYFQFFRKGKTDKMLISIRPRNSEFFEDMFTVPCDIICE